MSALSDLPTIDPPPSRPLSPAGKPLPAAPERANYQLFIVELCQLLGVLARPFWRAIAVTTPMCASAAVFRHGNGSVSQGFIDCYKRGCFVLEAKGSRKADGQVLSQNGRSPQPGQNYAAPCLPTVKAVRRFADCRCG